MNRNCEPRQRGFTLIEILLAITIAAIILLTVYGSVARTLSSKEIGEERAELFATGRDTVLRMAEEIEAALPPAAGDRILFRGGSEGGSVPRAWLELIVMNRGGYGMNRIRPGQIYVTYSLDPIPNKRGLFALRREEHLFSVLLDEADGIERPISDLEEEDPRPTSSATYLLDCPHLPEEINIPGSCTRVVGLNFRYLDDVEQGWKDTWDTTRDPEEPEYQRIPAAVEIALYLEDERGVIHDFTTIVDLPLGRAQPTPQPGEEDDDGGEEDD